MKTLKYDILSTDVYNIRPDIFIRSTEDKIHIQYAGKDFLINLPRDAINAVYEFLKLVDGEREISEVLTLIPEAYHRLLCKFLDFLIKQKAAFRVKGAAQNTDLLPVSQTLTYLRAYCDDSEEVFRRYCRCKILLVGGGYSLISAIKTFARLGTTHISVYQTGTFSENWTDAELHNCFTSLSPWPDARLSIESFINDAAPNEYTHVLNFSGVDREITKNVINLSREAQYANAHFVNGNICLTFNDNISSYIVRLPSQESISFSKDELTAGAVISLLFFDVICGIREIHEYEYCYYSLSEEQPVQKAVFTPLIPANMARSEISAGGVKVCSSFEQLSLAPLFPIAPSITAEPNSFLKIYSAPMVNPRPAHAHSNIESHILYGLGLSKEQCCRNMLLYLLCVYDTWFSNNEPSECEEVIEFYQSYLRIKDVLEPLRSQLNAREKLRLVENKAPSDYICFCINATFGQRVKYSLVELQDAEFPACTILFAGTVTIFLPHSEKMQEPQLFTGLLALYTALWQLREGNSNFLDVVLDKKPFHCESVAWIK